MELQKLTNGHHQDGQHLEEGYVSFISSDFVTKSVTAYLFSIGLQIHAKSKHALAICFSRTTP